VNEPKHLQQGGIHLWNLQSNLVRGRQAPMAASMIPAPVRIAIQELK